MDIIQALTDELQVQKWQITKFLPSHHDIDKRSRFLVR